MLASLAMPAIQVDRVELEEDSARNFTANGTIDESDAQTLLTNLNANNPIHVKELMDHSNKIHLV